LVNYLKMQRRQHVIALLELGWTYRRIERETGVRRETISRYDRMRQANPAKVFPGSEANAAKAFPCSQAPARSAAAGYGDEIRKRLDEGLTLQRIWQDLVEEFGYGHSYESVKRYVRGLLSRSAEHHIVPLRTPSG